MYKKIYKVLLVSSLALTMSSCEDLLDVKETDFIAGDIALRTVKNNESLIIGAYAGLQTEMAMRMNMVFSDEIKTSEFYNAQSTHQWQFNYDDVGIRDNYTAITGLYQIIDRANRAIAALPNAVEETTTDAELKNRLKGEALFIRALAHFDLFRYYCGNYSADGLGMPYLEVPSLEAQERLPMGPYFEKMLRDINESKTLLPNNLADKNRATKLAAVGLHARVALYTRNWTEAIAQSTEYINAIPLSPREQFDGLWKDQNTNETALMYQRNTGSRMGSFFRGLFTRNAQGVLQLPGQMSWEPSNKIWNSYDSTDIRFSSYLIDEPMFKAAGRPSKITKKFAGGEYASNTENVVHMKVFRTAEMYLIRAEAKAETNAFTGANSAESDINALRTARITGYKNATFTSKDAAMSAVKSERFKELAFEGHRFWDLKRWGMPVERLPEDTPAVGSDILSANNFRFTLPIPQSEMLANSKMVQNPGYAN